MAGFNILIDKRNEKRNLTFLLVKFLFYIKIISQTCENAYGLHREQGRYPDFSADDFD